jgi:hypothetical protein
VLAMPILANMSAMTFGTFHRRCAPGELAIILSHFEEVKSEIHLLIYQRPNSSRCEVASQPWNKRASTE